MYSAPTALISLIVFLPIFAGLSAVYFAHLQNTAVIQRDQMYYDIAELAASRLRGMIAGNDTLHDRITSGNLTQADLEYMSRIITQYLENVTGVPYRVNIKITVVQTGLARSGAGYDNSVEVLHTYELVTHETVAHWAYRLVREGDNYVLIGTGI